MRSKYLFQTILLLLLLVLSVGCFRSESRPLFQSSDNSNLSEDLGSWLGEYEYVYTSDNSETSKAVCYQLSIEMNEDQYFAVFVVEGWQTYYKAQATVEGNSDIITVAFDSYLDSNGWTFADSSTASQNRFENGDILFILERTDSGITTSLGEKTVPLMHEINFERSDNTNK